MFKILLHIFATAATLLLISRFVPGIAVDNFTVAVLVALLWGIIGLTIKPILFLLTLPITLITLGLFSFVLNAVLFWVLSTFVPGFEVAGFIPALMGSAILSLVSGVVHRLT